MITPNGPDHKKQGRLWKGVEARNQSVAKPKTNAIINNKKKVIKMKAKVYAKVILTVESERGFSIALRQTSVM